MNRFTSKHVDSAHGIKRSSHYHGPAYYDDPDYHEELDEYSDDYAYDTDEYDRYQDDDIE